ncbi:52_t:CDS:2 [Paraglomus brasilianum]|uniref:52_t:CDS:1 n=1 Tax=Paraglomus brasilianum TaxID=144538 RepID=A0A9N9CF70_9GLOM|nr:52_t:CDS:2 [Paraglomus brasilianum]
MKRKICSECINQSIALNDLEKSVDKLCKLVSDFVNDEKTITENDNIKRQTLSQLTLTHLQKRINDELLTVKLFEAPHKRCETETTPIENLSRLTIKDETKAQKSCRDCVKQCTLDAVKKSLDKLCETLNETHNNKRIVEKREISHLSTKDLNGFVLLCMDKFRR